MYRWRYILLGMLVWGVMTASAWGTENTPAAPPATISVAAVGDIMMGSDYPDHDLPPEDGRGLFAAVRELLAKADIAFGNLEAPLCAAGVCTKDVSRDNVFAFRTPPRFAATLRGAGIKVVSIANNHLGDFGLTGKLATKQALKEVGVQFSGQDGEVAQFTVGGTRVGVMAVTYGKPPRSITPPGATLAEIEALARQYDILIVSVHGGAEGRSYLHVSPGPEYFLEEDRGDLIKFAHQAIDRGADLILGHGPHVPRALEVYQGRLIAYSLGNFCTYKGMSLTGESGYAPLLWAILGPRGEFRQGEIHSFVQTKPGGPKRDPGGKAAKLMAQLSLEDFPESAPLITATGRIIPLMTAPAEKAAEPLTKTPDAATPE